MIAPWEKKLWQSEIVFKKQRYHLANNGPYSQSYDFSSSHVLMRELDHKEGWTLKNWCFQIVLTSRRSNQSILNKISPEYSLEGLRLGWSSNTLASWCKESTHWKRPWCWERLKAKGTGGGRGWDGWIASLNQWKWNWANSGNSGGQTRQLKIYVAFLCQIPNSTVETICSFWKLLEGSCSDFRCFRFCFNNVLFGSYLKFAGEILGTIFFLVAYILSIFCI